MISRRGGGVNNNCLFHVSQNLNKFASDIDGYTFLMVSFHANMGEKVVSDIFYLILPPFIEIKWPLAYSLNVIINMTVIIFVCILFPETIILSYLHSTIGVIGYYCFLSIIYNYYLGTYISNGGGGGTSLFVMAKTGVSDFL